MALAATRDNMPRGVKRIGPRAASLAGAALARFFLIWVCTAALGQAPEAVAVTPESLRDGLALDAGWRFHPGDVDGAADPARALAVDRPKQVRYFWRQAHWLTVRFPDAGLRDVAGLVKLADRGELEGNDWSPTPGRCVGVAPAEMDEDFDFETAMREIHVALADLNAEAVQLAAAIKRDFEELRI